MLINYLSIAQTEVENTNHSREHLTRLILQKIFSEPEDTSITTSATQAQGKNKLKKACMA